MGKMGSSVVYYITLYALMYFPLANACNGRKVFKNVTHGIITDGDSDYTAEQHCEWLIEGQKINTALEYFFGMIISLNDLKNVALTCIIAINCNIQQCTLITRFTYRGWIINNTRHHNKPVFVVILCFLSHYLQLRIKS